ncbi:MAG TPA: primosomal protein N' [Lacipirellulaceae bacterium]|nr:primosomal protein N' [Lacipirellulaceae bacterium]
MASIQQSLFETAPPQWEVDDAAAALVATVVLPVGPPGEFDYLVPPDMVGGTRPQRTLEAGMRVRVPLGRSNRRIVGYCVELATKTLDQRKLKPVAAVLDRRPLLSASMLRLTRWMADYYLCPWGQALEAVVPAGVRQDAGRRNVTFFTASRDALKRAEQLKLSPKQKTVLQILAASDRPLNANEIASRVGCTVGPINGLRKKGLLAATVERIGAERIQGSRYPRQEPHVLNADQVRALAVIRDALQVSEHRTVLIHGATGSGKTEVYIQAIQEVVRFGRQAILLVPEISLTPQTVARFRARFDRVAVLHSHMSDVERHEHWQRIADGNVEVVVGARSAIFAPTPHLGLIVLDEEHESTFKQETAPRYHARDVAARRAADQNVPLVLASATPSLESWHRAKRGDYQLVEMPRRVMDLPLPAVRTIDLRNEVHSKQSRGAISRPLHRAMDEALREGGQVILLLNRRGHSTHIQCPACGHSLRCPRCELALTFHRYADSLPLGEDLVRAGTKAPSPDSTELVAGRPSARGRGGFDSNVAVCHYCDYQAAAPTTCPKCDFRGIRFSGLGTQKLEAEVRARFPDYSCVRMDADSMRRHGSHEQALAAFREKRHQILLGTQMIAKGLDFPNVTLVGVVNADTALHLPDFRAAERTFQLVTQVAGRTGRGPKGGRVLVQTLSPDAPAITAAVRHDLAAFAREELPHREALGYPPFASMIRIVIRGGNDSATQAFSEELSRQLRTGADATPADLRILGPAPAPMTKLRGNYRYQIQLHATDGDMLRNVVRRATDKLKAPDGIAWIVDVDPLDMM